MAIKITRNPKYTYTVLYDGSEISRALQLVGINCVKTQTYCKAKHLISQRYKTTINIPDAELKLMLAKLYVSKNVGSYLSSQAENTLKFQLNFSNQTGKKMKQKQSRN